MKFISTTIVMLILLLNHSVAYAEDPVGWSTLTGTIEKTLFSDVSKLQGRTFNLVIPGATNEYKLTVRPAMAFSVDRLTTDKFQVTIINPEALVNRTNKVVEYYPIGWALSNEDIIQPIIEGDATCIATVTFNQPGVGPLNLSDFGPEYDVAYELSNKESILVVARTGKGFDITRVLNSIADSKIRLSIKKKNDKNYNLQTAWIAIPTCGTSQIVQTPPITIIPEPETEINAAELLDVKITSLSFCEDATGLFCSTLQVSAKNIGNKMVRCNKVWLYMKYNNQIVASDSRWIELASGQTTSFEVYLKAPKKSGNNWTYQIVKADCFYK